MGRESYLNAHHLRSLSSVNNYLRLILLFFEQYPETCGVPSSLSSSEVCRSNAIIFAEVPRYGVTQGDDEKIFETKNLKIEGKSLEYYF